MRATRPKAAYEALSVDKVAELLRDGALEYTEIGAFDWILNLMGGGDSATDKKLDEIQESIAEANAKLDHISAQIDALCQQLKNLAQQLQTLAYWGNFQQASRAAQENLDDMLNMVQKVTIIEGRTGADGKPLTTLSSTDAKTLAEMRTQLSTTQWLHRLVDSVGGRNGVIAAYIQVIENDMLHPQQRPDGTTPPVLVPPSTSHLFTATYMQPMQQLLEYYSRAMEQGLSALADLFHADFTYGGDHYQPDTDSVTSYLGVGLSAIDSWNSTAAGGLASIPDNTMVDENTTPYTMWTQSPVSVSADPRATAACVDPQVVCLADDFADDGTIMNTALVAPTNSPLIDQIKTAGYAGLTDWQVPTPQDYTTLLGEDGATPADIATWSLHHELGMFPVRAITSHTNGLGKPVAIVGPLLAVRGNQPGSVSTTDPRHRTVSFHSLPADGQNETGGALILKRVAAPIKLCTATWCVKAKQKRTTTARFSAHQVPAPHSPAVKSTAPINVPTTYNAPTSCSSGPTYTVDPNANAVAVTVTGAPGGAGKLNSKPDGIGGRGGTITTVVPIPGGAKLRVQVASPGGDTVAGVGGGATGGATVPASWPDTKHGDHSGGGGGASGIASLNCSRWLVVAGGGGGGGSSFHSGGTEAGGTWHGGRGGDACPLPGTAEQKNCINGQDGTDDYPHTKLGQPGGTPPTNTGGHNRDGTGLAGGNGTVIQGGNGSDGDRKDGGDGGAGGGGGGGFYGGGGGGGGGIHAGGGGGGGGGDFAIPGVITNQTTYGFNATQTGSVQLTSVQIDNIGRIKGHAPVTARPATSAPPLLTHVGNPPTAVRLAATGLPANTRWLLAISLLALVAGAGALAAGSSRRRRG